MNISSLLFTMKIVYILIKIGTTMFLTMLFGNIKKTLMNIIRTIVYVYYKYSHMFYIRLKYMKHVLLNNEKNSKLSLVAYIQNDQLYFTHVKKGGCSLIHVILSLDDKHEDVTIKTQGLIGPFVDWHGLQNCLVLELFDSTFLEIHYSDGRIQKLSQLAPRQQLQYKLKHGM